MDAMRTARITLIVLLAVAGCDALGRVKVDNPVAGVAPPRTRMSNDDDPGIARVAENPLVGEEPGAAVVPVVLSQSPDELDDLSGSRTVALVNGIPVLASEVLAPYEEQIAKATAEVRTKVKLASQQAQAERELRQMRLFIIQRDLKGHVDRKLLQAALRETLKAEQAKMLDEIVGKEFDKEVEAMMKQEGVQTRTELELKLQEHGRTLAGLRDDFFSQRMAMEYLGYKSQSKAEVGRQDILGYYEGHVADFTVPAKVKWQQLLVSFRKHGGRAGAQGVLDKALAELKSGAEFGEVVRKHSNGLHAETGGTFGWTEAESLGDPEVQKALFSLPVGATSKVIEGSAAFQIVRVVDRQEASRKPLFEVQDEIRESLEKDRRRELARTVLEDLRQNAVIVTIFDGQQPPKTAERR